MRILLAAHGFPPTHSAGAERRAKRMADWFAKAGHHVEVIAVESVSASKFEVRTSSDEGYPIHRLYFDLNAGGSFQNLYNNPNIGPVVREILTSTTFDLVHIVSGYLLGGQVIHTAHEFGLPVVITLTEYWFLCSRLNLLQATGELCTGPETDQKCMQCLMEDKRRYRLPAEYAPHLADTFWSVARHLPFAVTATDAIAKRRTTLHAALDAVDLVICPSEFLISKYAEFGFDTRNYVYMRQGLDLSSQITPRQPDDQRNTLRLGYIGQIQPHKGVDLLIEAAIELLDRGYPISLDIWGSDKQAPRYSSQLKARSAAYTAIHWNGRYTGSQVWDVLASIDVMVAPSRWYENSPNVILEAYAMRIPVVCTNLGGMAELVEHEHAGLVFELNSAPDLAHQLKRLVDEPGLLPRLRTGIPGVKTIDDEMKTVVQHYDQLMKQQTL